MTSAPTGDADLSVVGPEALTFTTIDRNYLHMQSPGQPMQWTLVFELDPLRRIDLEVLRRRVGQRAQQYELFRTVVTGGSVRKQRAIRVERIEVSHHVVEHVVDGTAGLWTLIAQGMAAALDARRPPWRVNLITDQHDGRQHLVIMAHHCLADGVAAAGFAALVVDTDDEAAVGQFERFLTSPRFVPPATGVAQGLKSTHSFYRSWREGQGSRWPSLTPGSGREAYGLSIPTAQIRRASARAGASTGEYLMAAMAAGTARIASAGDSSSVVRAMVPISLDPNVRHTGNAAALALVNIPVAAPSLNAQLDSVRAQFGAIAEQRPELALPWLSQGESVVPWFGQRLLARGGMRLIQPDVCLGVSPAFTRLRSVCESEVRKVYPFTPLAGYSLAASALVLGLEVSIGIVADSESRPGYAQALGMELEMLLN